MKARMTDLATVSLVAGAAVALGGIATVLGMGLARAGLTTALQAWRRRPVAA